MRFLFEEFAIYFTFILMVVVIVCLAESSKSDSNVELRSYVKEKYNKYKEISLYYLSTEK